MKKKVLFIFLLFLILNACKLSDPVLIYKDTLAVDSNNLLEISISKGKELNHPTFVIWQEDAAGKYVQTLFITKSYASGIFNQQMQGDTVWLKTPGQSFQPAALPYWSNKKGPIYQNEIVPKPEHPFVDAYTGATPNQSFQFSTSKISADTAYRLLLEVNQTWDWNSYWTNNKYPENSAYKHSAQPSLIYSVTINPSDTLVYMSLIGHGNPTGEDGELFSDLSTISTAKEIFKSIKIEIKKQ